MYLCTFLCIGLFVGAEATTIPNVNTVTGIALSPEQSPVYLYGTEGFNLWDTKKGDVLKFQFSKHKIDPPPPESPTGQSGRPPRRPDYVIDTEVTVLQVDDGFAYKVISGLTNAWMAPDEFGEVQRDRRSASTFKLTLHVKRGIVGGVLSQRTYSSGSSGYEVIGLENGFVVLKPGGSYSAWG